MTCPDDSRSRLRALLRGQCPRLGPAAEAAVHQVLVRGTPNEITALADQLEAAAADHAAALAAAQTRLRPHLNGPDRRWSDEALDEADRLIVDGDLDRIHGVLRHLESTPPLTHHWEREIARIKANADPATQAVLDALDPLPPTVPLRPQVLERHTEPDPDPDPNRWDLAS